MSTFRLEALLNLWRSAPADTEAAIRAFAQFYTDPVIVNGTPMALQALVERARAQQRALSEIDFEVLERLDMPGYTVIAFVHRAKHTGPMITPLGEVAATGKPIARKTIDILRFRDDRICEVHVVSDELGGLTQLGVVRLS